MNYINDIIHTHTHKICEVEVESIPKSFAENYTQFSPITLHLHEILRLFSQNKSLWIQQNFTLSIVQQNWLTILSHFESLQNEYVCKLSNCLSPLASFVEIAEHWECLRVNWFWLNLRYTSSCYQTCQWQDLSHVLKVDGIK